MSNAWTRVVPALLAVATVGVGAGPIEITVDCDRGGDLAAVLADLVDRTDGPVVVNVAGTCAGPIEIATDDVTLRGESSGTSAIEGVGARFATPPPAVVTAHGVRNLRLEKLRISDGPVGVAAIAAEVTIESSELSRTDVGVAAQLSSVALAGVTLRDGRIGVEARRSRVGIGFSTIDRISDEAIAATEFSEIVMLHSTAVSDGLSVRNSGLVATRCELEGSIHARSHSRVSLGGSAGSTAALRGGISASNSEVFLFQLPVDGAVSVSDGGFLTAIGAGIGSVLLASAADARISSGHVAGAILVDGFSTAQLVSTAVAGEVVCRRGADALCEQSQLASVSGCRNCEGTGTTPGTFGPTAAPGR